MTGRDLKDFAATVKDTDEIEFGFCSWNSLDKKNIRAVAVTRPQTDLPTFPPVEKQPWRG